MVQSPSWEANWFVASQEIPRISRNPKVHYRTHKRPPPVPILGQPNPVHKPTSHLLEIHPYIIHPSTPRSPQWSLSLLFPTKTLYTPLSSPIRATWRVIPKCLKSVGEWAPYDSACESHGDSVFSFICNCHIVRASHGPMWQFNYPVPLPILQGPTSWLHPYALAAAHSWILCGSAAVDWHFVRKQKV